MKNLFLSLIIFTTSSYSYALETVDFVEVSKYLGRWYQISRNPLPFEPRICACAQQSLSLRGDGNVDVYNSCNAGGVNGDLQGIRGVATNVEPETNSKFSVDFGFPRLGSYWIIGLDSDYRWAVVSDAKGGSLYILSKTPSLEEGLYQQALDSAVKQDLGLEKLLVTEQVGCRYP